MKFDVTEHSYVTQHLRPYMNRRSKSALLALLPSVVIFVAAVLWGVYFAYPEPDAAPEKAAQIRLHSTLSGWLMLLAAGTFLVSCITLAVGLLAKAKEQRLD